MFVFEKKFADKLHKPGRKEKVAEVLRRGATVLSQLRHPRLLRVYRPLEENT